MFAQHLPFLPNCTLPEGMGRSDQRPSTNSSPALPKRWAEGGHSRDEPVSSATSRPCLFYRPQQAPGPFGVFSGGPRRDVRRAARRDLQDDQRHDPRALVHHVFVLSRCLRFSLVRFFFVTSSSVRFPFRVQRWDSFFWCPEVALENYISTSGRSHWTRSRRRSSQSSSVNRRRSTLRIRSPSHSKTCAPPQPQREREFRTILPPPLDTST